VIIIHATLPQVCQNDKTYNIKLLIWQALCHCRIGQMISMLPKRQAIFESAKTARYTKAAKWASCIRICLYIMAIFVAKLPNGKLYYYMPKWQYLWQSCQMASCDYNMPIWQFYMWQSSKWQAVLLSANMAIYVAKLPNGKLYYYLPKGQVIFEAAKIGKLFL
jgi:hypothetical protein